MDCISGFELTEDQSQKLVIMARAFFPNLQTEAINKSINHYGNFMKVEDNLCGFHLTRTGFLHCSYPYLTPNKTEQHFLLVRVHWFEFCMRILCPIIVDSALELYNYDGYRLSNHPVDILYNKYSRFEADEIRYLVRAIEKGQVL